MVVEVVVAVVVVVVIVLVVVVAMVVVVVVIVVVVVVPMVVVVMLSSAELVLHQRLKLPAPRGVLPSGHNFHAHPIEWVQVKLVLAHGTAGAVIVALVAVVIFVHT